MDLNNRRTGKEASKPRTLGLFGQCVNTHKISNNGLTGYFSRVIAVHIQYTFQYFMFHDLQITKSDLCAPSMYVTSHYLLFAVQEKGELK